MADTVKTTDPDIQKIKKMADTVKTTDPDQHVLVEMVLLTNHMRCI